MNHIRTLRGIFVLIMLTFPINVLAAVSLTPASDTVLPGSVRSVYSNVQGSANTAVTWSATGGTLANSTGFTTWTAPSAPGSYTVTATSVADNSQMATSTFTVISNATVKVSNIPAQATVFKNQPLIIQSILWGSSNTAVAWSSSGGALTGAGREVVFSANTAGTYTVTATSSADNTKAATTTVVVTGNAWPAAATPNKTQPVDCTATGSGATYEVTSETEMDAVPWSILGAGDTVRIHPGIYHRQLLVSTSGTSAQPIRICGVPDSNGNLPELNGSNATAMAGSQFGTYPWSIQQYGGIIIYNNGGSYYGGAVYPKNIIIEGLKLSGYNRGNTFTDLSNGNAVTAYNKAAASIRIQRGANITIRGNDISGCGNGIFTMSNNGVESQATRNLLIEGNYIHGNGVSGDYLEHQSYLQSFGLVVQGNYYDFPLSGMPGSQLKTRAVQQFIRYNYFEPAARILDLVEVQDDWQLVYPWAVLDSKELVNTSSSDVIANYEAYQNRFVYGNIIHNVGPLTAAYLVHGSADNDQDGNPGGTLYFYNNTISGSLIKGQTSNWRNGLFDFGPYDTATTTHSVWPTAKVTNNAIHIAQSNPASGMVFFWNRYMPDRVVLDKNWISTGWGTGKSTGGDGTGIANAAGQGGTAAVWQGGQLATQVSGISNLVTGSTIPFDSNNYVPKPGSPLINASSPLTGLAASLPPLMQYSPVSYLMSVRNDIVDIGALGAPQITGRPLAPTGLRRVK